MAMDKKRLEIIVRDAKIQLADNFVQHEMNAMGLINLTEEERQACWDAVGFCYTFLSKHAQADSNDG